jgi:hypothetical protein
MHSRCFSLHKEVPFLRKKKARHAVVVSRPNATFRPHVRHGPLRFDLRCLLLFPVRAISKCSRTHPYLPVCGGRLPRADSTAGGSAKYQA